MIYRLIQSAVAYAAGRSSKWPGVRRVFLDGKSCAACGGTDGIEAHHVLPVHLYPEHELRVDFLVALCRTHHLEIGHAGDWRAFNPRVIEDAALMLKRRRERAYKRLEVVR